MKISRPETMSGKIRHLENICENISLRKRGKVFPYKMCDRHVTDRQTHGHRHLEKALLALKNQKNLMM